MSLKDTWVDIQIGDKTNPALVNDIAHAVIEDEKNIQTNNNNIDINAEEIKKNKRETSQNFSNALKANLKGKRVSLSDVSPIEHTVNVKVSGKNLYGLAGRVEGSLGGYFSPSQRTFTGYGIYYAIAGSDYYSDMFDEGFSDKYSYDENTNTLTVASSSVNYGLAIDISVKPSTTYTISGSFSSGSYCYISQYDKDGYFIKSDMKKNASIKTEPNAAWVLIVLMATKDSGTVTATNLQFEEGSVATEYEPGFDPTITRVNLFDSNGNPYLDLGLDINGTADFPSSLLLPNTIVGEETGELFVEVEYNRDINTLDIGSGGSAQGDYIPMPTTAQVGDVLKVKGIDENGKPIEWECAKESGTSDKWELVTSYTHSGNKIIQPTALDMSTGYFTCENHGLVTGDYVTPFYNVGITNCPIPFELLLKANYNNSRLYPTCHTVTVIDENTFMITGKSSYATTNNTNVDVTKVRFETQNTDFTGFNNLDIDLNLYDVKIVAHDFGKRVSIGLNNLKGYQNSYNKLEIDTGHEYGYGQGIPVTPIGGVESYGSVVLSLKNGVLYGDCRQYMKPIMIKSSALEYSYSPVGHHYNYPVLTDGLTLTTLNRLAFNDYYGSAVNKPKNGGWIQVWKRLRQYQ